MDSDWKGRKNSLIDRKAHFKKDEVEEESYQAENLDESEVEEYSGSLYASVYPKKMLQSKEN